MRTEEQANIVKYLDGVHQVGDEFDKTINEIHGLVDMPARSLSRIPGKKLATTGTGLEPVWSIYNLQFRDKVTILQRDGADLRAWSVPPPVSGVRFPLVPFGDGSDSPDRPNPPYPDPGGFPQGPGGTGGGNDAEETRDKTDAGDRTTPSPTDTNNFNIAIAALPSSITLRTDLSTSREFDIVITGGPIGSQVNYFVVRADWAEAWVGISYESNPGISFGLGNGGVAPFRSVGNFEAENIQMKASGNPNGLADGVYTDIVTFTLLYETSGRLYHNANGSNVTATLNVTFYVGNPSLVIITPSPIVFSTVEDK